MEVIRSTGGSLTSTVRGILGTYTPTGDSFGGADWEYIFSGLILCIALYCVLRMIGSLFK